MTKEIEALRKEIAELRAQVAALAAAPQTHIHHHYAPLPAVQPFGQVWPPQPWTPNQWPIITCGDPLPDNVISVTNNTAYTGGSL